MTTNENNQITYDGWVYYSHYRRKGSDYNYTEYMSISKKRPDGSECELLYSVTLKKIIKECFAGAGFGYIECPPSSVLLDITGVSDGWIYFETKVRGNEGTPYKIRIDGTDAQKLPKPKKEAPPPEPKETVPPWMSESVGRRWGAVHKLTKSNRKALTYIALHDESELLRRTAVKKLAVQSVLSEIAINDKDYAVRRNAVFNLKDQKLLSAIAQNDESPAVRWAAADMLEDRDLAQKVYEGIGEAATSEYTNYRGTVYFTAPGSSDEEKWYPEMTEMIENHADIGIGEDFDFSDCRDYYYHQGWVYFKYSGSSRIFYRMRPDGCDIERVCHFSSEGYEGFIWPSLEYVEDGWIYFSSTYTRRDGTLKFKMCIDGSDVTEIGVSAMSS